MPDLLESSVQTIHQTDNENPSACFASSASSVELASYADTLSSILDLPSAATFIDEDPHANPAAKQTQRSLLRNFYQGLEYQRDIGQGAVFRVGLYISKFDKREYAVKHAIRSQTRRIFRALQEILVTGHDALARHENIIHIFGWDVSMRREPVIIVEYASNSTLRDFLRADKLQREPVCNWNDKRNFALDVAAGLSAIHAADIAHGDIKLDNTLVFPHPSRQWYVKLSDFSHSTLGISTKRITSYLGSGIYNAPEVRKREDYIFSNLLPSCETFSYGLLVWELLKDGQSFLQSDWLGHSGISSDPDVLQKIPKDVKIAWLEQLPHNNLLDRAMAFLGTLRTMSRFTSSTFAFVFEQSLKDRSGLRSAMSTITSMLDYEDRATILYSSTTVSIKPIAIWDFVPWATKHPWSIQVDIRQGYLDEVQDSVQPNHAEWYLLLARCHAEGFGTAINYDEMIDCLRKSASHGSLESSFMLLFIEPHFSDSTLKVAPLKKDLMVHGVPIFKSSVEIAMQRIRRFGSLLSPPLQYIGMIQSWSKENSYYVQGQAFNLQGATFFWGKDADMARFLDTVRSEPLSIWDITIEFQSLESSLQTGGFFETCAAFGVNEWWIMAMDFAQHEQNINTEQKEVVFYNCLISALQHGESFFIDIMEAQSDQKFLKGLANTVIGERSNSPFHFLHLYSTNDAKLESVASKLLNIGLGETINQTITKKLWLRPFGIGLYGTPLHMAVRVRSLPAVKALINAGANPTESFGMGKGSPLELAISLNLYEIVQCMLDGVQVTDEIVQFSTQALGKYSDKGVFDNWLLHSTKSAPTAFLSVDMQRTIRELSHRFEGIELSREVVLLQYLETGCKSAKKLKLLWRFFEKKVGYRKLSSQAVEKGLVLAEQTVGDDPVNRDLLRFFFTSIIPLNNNESTDIRPDVLIPRWIKSGAINIINDFSLCFTSEEWSALVRAINGTTSVLVDAAISSGCSRMFDFVILYLSTEDCLSRAIDCRSKEFVTHIVKCVTIFCKLPTTTALHHATATSNITMVQHLLTISISRTAQHVQFLNPTSRSDAGNQSSEFRVFRWEPVFNMQDRSDSNHTALDIAADTDCIMSMEALLANDNISEGERSGQTMVALAVRNGQVNLVKRLLMRQYPPYCTIPVSELTILLNRGPLPEWNFIFQSIYHTFRGDIELSTLARLLALCKDEDIKRIEKINPSSFWETDSLWNGWLPLHYAIFCGQIDIFRTITASGIWSPNAKTTQHRHNTGQRLTTRMAIWSNAFDYRKLLEKDNMDETNDPATNLPTKKKRPNGAKHKVEVTPPSPNLKSILVTHLEDESLSNKQYRYCDLWARGQEFTMDLNQVHDLIWASKTGRQLALDLILWHSFVELPYRQGQQRTVDKALRSDIVFNMNDWIRLQNQKAEKSAELSPDNHAPMFADIDKSLLRYLREVSEVGPAASTPNELLSVATETVRHKDTPGPEKIVSDAGPTIETFSEDPHPQKTSTYSSGDDSDLGRPTQGPIKD